ncbi:hypothetical protein Tco_1022584 [Tanacetum coccineum]
MRTGSLSELIGLLMRLFVMLRSVFVTSLRLGFGDWQWRLATLPIAYGGLGVYSAGDVLNFAFLVFGHNDALEQNDAENGQNWTKAWKSVFRIIYNIDEMRSLRLFSGLVNAVENNNDQAEDAQFDAYEFINPFATPWTKDHLLEQVLDDPTKPVQARQKLATDAKLCMFALTMSTTKPKNIKEVMADQAWIEAMQEELYHFDRLGVWELIDKPFGKNVFGLK